MNIAAHQTHDRIPAILFREHPRLELALRLIRMGHGKQAYNGAPYFHHPIRVMLRMNWFAVQSDDIYAALFHDLLEDTEITIDDMKFFGYSPTVIELVLALTREKDGEVTYKQYIHDLIKSGNVRAMRIKLADLYENSNNVRFLLPEKRKILVRYGKSMTDLHEELSKTVENRMFIENTLSGELDEQTLEAWTGQKPGFL